MVDIKEILDVHEKGFVCETCGKVFSSRDEYKQHNCDRHIEGGCNIKWH